MLARECAPGGAVERGIRTREEAVAKVGRSYVGWKSPKNSLTITPADIPRLLEETQALEAVREALTYTMAKPAPVEVDEVAKGPVTAAEFDVPGDWVDRAGMPRAENLKRYGEDEAIEYWPPIAAKKLDVDAPLDLAAVKS
jgi:hypothetical protein